MSADTAGQCCWPQQAWSNLRKACVGTPQCPAGLQPKGEECGCAAGQEISLDTAGRCCWPGQAWSMSRKQCVGVPSCAAGWRVEQESCVAAAGEPQAPVAEMPMPPPAPMPGDGPNPTASALPAAPVEAVTAAPVKTRFRTGLIITGASLFAAGYALSVVLAIASSGDIANNPNGGCVAQVATYGFIPLVGPGLGITNQIGRQSGASGFCTSERSFLPMVIAAGIETALQIAGLALFGVGFKRVEVPAEANAGRRDGVQLLVSAGAPGSLLGVTLKLTHW